MSVSPEPASVTDDKLNSNFLKFWIGQTVSNLGNAFSLFAFPLIIFKLTGSALDLAFTSFLTYMPYLLFGLVIGAWVDRVHRRRLMIGADLIRSALLLSIPILSALGQLSIWWVYTVAFLSSTLAVCFNTAQFAAIPSLVENKDLVAANGRIQATYSAALIIGPILAGLVLAVLPIESLFVVDACSFLISATSLSLISISFTAADKRSQTSVRQDMVEGLRYVWRHPVLRTVAIFAAIQNFLGITLEAQIVLFTKAQFAATDSQISLFYSAAGVGILLFSLAAGILRRYASFSAVAIGAVFLRSLVPIVLVFVPSLWLALPIWAIGTGATMLFAINTNSLRQTITPNAMMGRVMSINQMLALCAVPVGTLLGGFAIEQVGSVAPVYFGIGFLNIIITSLFIFSPLGHTERYLVPESASNT